VWHYTLRIFGDFWWFLRIVWGRERWHQRIVTFRHLPGYDTHTTLISREVEPRSTECRCADALSLQSKCRAGDLFRNTWDNQLFQITFGGSLDSGDLQETKHLYIEYPQNLLYTGWMVLKRGNSHPTQAENAKPTGSGKRWATKSTTVGTPFGSIWRVINYSKPNQPISHKPKRYKASMAKQPSQPPSPQGQRQLEMQRITRFSIRWRMIKNVFYH
jgi:hypothetical protein